MDQVRDYFDRVAPQWDRMRRGYFTEDVQKAVIEHAALQPAMTVADVGCGSGFLTEAVSPLVAQVYALDGSPAMLDQARARLATLTNVRYLVADGASLPLPAASVDRVVANMFLHHVADPAAVLKEMARVLRPGGRLVLSDLDEHQEEWMRAEMADVWLGFARPQVAQWLADAGLTDVAVDCAGSNCCADKPCGGRAAISIFIAEGTRIS